MSARPAAKKRKRAVLASVQAISQILRVTPDAVVRLVAQGRLKARRHRNRLQVDVMCPVDEYAINYDSVLAYRELFRKRGETNARSERPMAGFGKSSTTQAAR